MYRSIFFIFASFVAAYAAAVLFCLSEDSRKQAAVPTNQLGIRNDVSLPTKAAIAHTLSYP